MSEIQQSVASVVVDDHYIDQPDLAKLLAAPPVTLTIDGQAITIKATSLAVDPATNKQFARPTTIYDAATELVREGKFAKHPIPILCHREHLTPVAACRFCVVDVVGGRVLAPACFRQVEDKMTVQTAQTSEKVKKSVSILTQLLLADHDAPRQVHTEYGDNELRTIARNLGLDPHTSPFPRTAVRPDPFDESSLAIAVDHNACILCDRCIRGCNEIRNNQVLGRMGKGYRARIAFDLNDPMGESSCVSCGECMVSCPTGALTNRKFALREIAKDSTIVEPAALFGHPLFEGVSVQFLGFNKGSIVRRTFKPGEIICREGEFGHTAFLLEKGEVEVYLHSFNSVVAPTRAKGNDKTDAANAEPRRIMLGDAPVVLELKPGTQPTAVLTPKDILFGEMSCMNNYPRSATIRAKTDVSVLEITKNVLHILLRSRKSRALLEKAYAERAVNGHLRIVPLFKDLQKDDAQFERFVQRFKERMKLVRFANGEVIFRQGDAADSFFLVKVGFVKVSVRQPGGDRTLDYVGPGGFFGEIALLSQLPEMAGKSELGKRTATCAAIDHVDCVKIAAEDFKQIILEFPALRTQLVGIAQTRLAEQQELEARSKVLPLDEFVRQGLMNARSLLVLDLTKCTRCDECTKACHDAHLDDITRLIRDGLRYQNWLVASACRACLDPYCMSSCPVDSIHRNPKTGEMLIENHCIGCGQCANNCPYGNINMHGVAQTEIADPAAPGGRRAVVQQRASMCDLCMGHNAREHYNEPSCVYACPHDAAHRYSGDEFRAVLEKQAGRRR